MEEQILKMINNNAGVIDITLANGLQYKAPTLDTQKLSKEIAAHFVEFIEWIRSNCKNDVFGRNHAGYIRYELRWFIEKDVDDWEGMPNETYNSTELYHYWLENVKK